MTDNGPPASRRASRRRGLRAPALLRPAAVAALALAAAGCTSLGIGGPPDVCRDPGCAHIDSRLDVAPVGRNEATKLGNYLAARHATARRDRDAAAEFYDQVLRTDPGNEAILERAFLLQVAAGNFGRAVDLAERVVARTEGDRTARLVLAMDAFRRGDYAQARAQVEAASPGPFTRLVASLLSAWSHVGEGAMDAALAALEIEDEGPGHKLFTAYHTGLIADLAGRPDAAGEAFEAAMAASGGGSVRIVQAYGRFLERTGRAADAVVIYSGYLALSPDHPLISAALERARSGEAPDPLVTTARQGAAETLYGLGSALSRDQGADISILYLRLALFANGDLDVARVLMAELLSASGDIEGAEEAYGSVPRASPLATTARIEQALLLERMDRPDDAIRELRRLERRVTDNPDVAIALADLLRSRERFAEAETRYTDAIEMVGEPASRHWTLFYARGVTRERQDKWDEAEADFFKALDLEPDQPFVLNYLGYSWLEQHRNLDEALDMIVRAVEQRPNDGFIVDSLGWAYYRLGRYAEAVEHLERAVELDPHDPTINDHLGDAFWKVGRRTEARFQWRHALASDPEPDQAARIERKLESGLDVVEAAEAADKVRPGS